MDTIRTFRTLTLLGIVMAIPATASAQGITMPIAPGSTDALTRSDELVALVHSGASPSQWEGKARLLEEAATLRGLEDPEAENLLEQSANLHYRAGDHRRARLLLERAAIQSLNRGEIEPAADRFLKAAWVAAARGHHREATRLALRAEQLTRSPLLSDDERRLILARIDRTQVR